MLERFKPEPIDFFKDENKTIEDFDIEEIKEQFKEIKHTKLQMKYTHPLTQAFGPSKCDIQETQTAYFVSPTKIVIRYFIEQFGFTFCDWFNPMGIVVLEQDYDKKKNKFSVNLQFFFRVDFVKSVSFFKSKIKNEALAATQKVYSEYFDPMVTEYMAKYQPKFVRPVPKLKKKMTKAAKLQLQIEDMEADHQEEIAKLRKDYESQVSALKNQLEQASVDHNTVLLRVKIAAVVAVFVLIIFKLLV